MNQVSESFRTITQFIRDTVGISKGFVPLHAPYFRGNEEQYVVDTIKSTYVSSVGRYVDKFEEDISEIVGTKYAIATGTGTSALHVALKLAGVKEDSEVITQALSFIATANAISYLGAKPIFVDVGRESLGMSPAALREFLEQHTELDSNGHCLNKSSGKKITACVPMHTFGFPCKISEIKDICDEYHIPLIEDSAESIGSTVGGKHTGTFGLAGIFSFNGNKTVTCGGGGAIVTDDETLASQAKHITTTAKVSHKWEYRHDKVGYNYRMPNLNAALACAQLEQLQVILDEKRKIAEAYRAFFERTDITFVNEPSETIANFWLNTIILRDLKIRDEFLEYTNARQVMTRPAWVPLNELIMYEGCQTDSLRNTKWLADRIVNIPSSAVLA